MYPFVFKFNTFRPLNYMPYNKDIAIKELESIGWKSYSRKHGESFFTKFYQNHYLPKRFGYDKRLPHLSSMIMSNSISREEALKKIDEPLYNETELINDINYLVKKLDISIEEYDHIEKNFFIEKYIWLFSNVLYYFLKKWCFKGC